MQVIQAFPNATNLIDAALARPILDSDVLDENLEIGAINGQTEAALGLEVCKTGRTTAFTKGTVNVLDATVTVNYGDERTATFDHQIVSTPMSEGGDSGSLLVASQTKQAVGLLFAGSSQATLFNPIQAVLKALKIDLPGSGAKSISDQRSAVEKAQAVKDAYTGILMSKPNVVGVGIGLIKVEGQRTGQVGLVVMVSHKVPLELLAPEDRDPRADRWRAGGGARGGRDRRARSRSYPQRRRFIASSPAPTLARYALVNKRLISFQRSG